MSVLGRKMFKDPSNRGARNMLKGMGGIMSSSPELANAVQGYADAGQVTIPGSTNDSTVIPDTLKSVWNWITKKIAGGAELTTEEANLFNQLSNIRSEPIGVTQAWDPSQAMDPEYEAFMRTMISDNLGGIATEEGGADVNLSGNQENIIAKEIEQSLLERDKNLNLINTNMTLVNFLKDKANMSVEEIDSYLTENPDKRTLLDLSTAEKLNLQNLNIEYEDPLQRLRNIEEEEKRAKLVGIDKESLPPELLEERTTQGLDQPLSEGSGGAPPELESGISGSGISEPEVSEEEAVEAVETEEAVEKIPAEAGLGQTNAEKSASVEDLMKVFKDNAPEYEGMDKGMAIAKIGFAIASGKDPNALVNIAEGLKEGVEDQIKDKARRDEFNRQVDLAALQYAVGEKSTIDAEGRAVKRQIDKEGREYTNYVVGPGGTTYRGVKYKEGMTIPVLRKDIYENNVPENIMDVANRNALLTKQVAVTKANASLVETGTLSAQEVKDNQEKYASAVKSAADSEIAMAIGDSILIKIAEEGENIFGFSGAVKDLIKKGAYTLGMKAPKGYGSIEEIRADFDFLLQQLIPTTLAESQSANSISNRDVEFLITAFFGPGALTGGSPLTFVTQNPEVLAGRVQNAMVKIANAQRADFAAMNEVETYISGFMFAPGGVLASSTVLEEQKKIRQEKGFGTNPSAQTFTGLGEPIRVDEFGRNVYKISD